MNKALIVSGTVLIASLVVTIVILATLYLR